MKMREEHKHNIFCLKEKMKDWLEFNSFKDILDNCKPSKEFVQRIEFELDQIQSSLFASFFNARELFSDVQDEIRYYVSHCGELKNGSELPEERKKTLLSLKAALENIFVRLQHEDKKTVREALKKILQDHITLSNDKDTKELLCKILGDLCEMSYFTFGSEYVASILSTVSKVLESDGWTDLDTSIFGE